MLCNQSKHTSPCYIPSIQRLPSKKCSIALSRKVLARIVDCSLWKIVIVFDTEYRRPELAVEDIASHFNKHYHKNMEFILVEPKHETWLCIGLCGDYRKCRTKPEGIISNIIGRKYEKQMLTTLAKKIDIEKLLNIENFETISKPLNG